MSREERKEQQKLQQCIREIRKKKAERILDLQGIVQENLHKYFHCYTLSLVSCSLLFLLLLFLPLTILHLTLSFSSHIFLILPLLLLSISSLSFLILQYSKILYKILSKILSKII